MKVAQNNLLFETKKKKMRKKSGSYKETSNLLPEISVIWKVTIIFSSFDIRGCLNVVFQNQENNWNVKASVSGSPCINVHHVPLKLEELQWVEVWQFSMKAINVCWKKPDQTPSWGNGIQFPLKLTGCVAAKSETELEPRYLVRKPTPSGWSPQKE